MLIHQTVARYQAIRRDLYYGWYVAGACGCIAVLTNGIGVFSQGVFLAYYSQAYGWSLGLLSLGPMLFHLWAGAVGVMVGRLIDRRGTRPAHIAGALMLAAGVLALGLTN